jgi:peptide-methionine (S)-S-oxide reductase
VILPRLRPHLVDPAEALPGRDDYAFAVPQVHAVNGRPIHGPWPDGLQTVVVGMGCFWGAERRFWQTEGVWTTAVGYAGGFTPFPTYEETCTGRTGHTEAVLVVFDPAIIDLEGVLKVFWESHDPTQGFRQGNDLGTQYRSAVLWTDPAQEAVVRTSAEAYEKQLAEAGFGSVTTELAPLRDFYYAEAYHQQYLEKNQDGYCGIGGTGVSCPVGVL